MRETLRCSEAALSPSEATGCIVSEPSPGRMDDALHGYLLTAILVSRPFFLFSEERWELRSLQSFSLEPDYRKPGLQRRNHSMSQLLIFMQITAVSFLRRQGHCCALLIEISFLRGMATVQNQLKKQVIFCCAQCCCWQSGGCEVPTHGFMREDTEPAPQGGPTAQSCNGRLRRRHALNSC